MRIKKYHLVRAVISAFCLAIVVSSTAYLVGSFRFFRTHFGNNVSINGIDVSRQSQEKAYETVNSLGNNWMVLRDNQIYTSHDGATSDFVTKKDINNYFKQQYSFFGNDKSWNFAPRNLSRDRKALNEFKHKQIIYRVAGENFKLKSTDLFDIVYYKNGKYHYESDDNYRHVMNEINKKTATLNKRVELTTPDGQKIQVVNKSYGWQINSDAAEQAIMNAFNNDEELVDGSKYISGIGYNRSGTGYNQKANNGLGNNYVLVSLKQQRLWVIKDNKPIVTLDDVVTGTTDPKKNDATPTGVWYIMYKQSPSILKGKNSDGSNYASKVQYWIPFTQNGCGIHDASWRTDWGKTAYQSNGSHGCINIKPNEIKRVWDNVDKNEPVVIYDE